jgi:hypothetical protein
MKRRQAKKLRSPKLVCPFCDDLLPEAEMRFDVFSGEGCQGGKCKCGAAYALDEIGRAGGQAILDAVAILVDGDLDRAMSLKADLDYQVESRPFTFGPARFSSGFSQPTAALPKIFAARFTKDEK